MFSKINSEDSNLPSPDYFSDVSEIGEDVHGRTYRKRKAESPVIKSLPNSPSKSHRKEVTEHRYFQASVTLSPSKKLRACHIEYSKRVLELHEEGKSRLEVEAIVAIEIAFDPYVENDEKTDFLPLPTGAEGTAGSYYIFDRIACRKIGVFKPRDEEQFMPNNPSSTYRRPYDPDSTDRPGNRKGHEPGGGWRKEIAAFIVGGDFADVPFTCLLKVPFPIRRTQSECVIKEGSFQAFAPGKLLTNCTRKEISNLPTFEVHKIAAFDLLTGSGDRTLANLIYDDISNRLIPIDHGYNFLDSLDWMKSDGIKSETKFAWIRLEQIKQPVDPEAKKWALNYDVEKNTSLLRKLGISEGSIREHKVRVFFAQWGLRQGFDFQYLGRLSSPSSSGKNSLIADMVMEAKARLGDSASNETLFFATFEKVLSDTLLESWS